MAEKVGFFEIKMKDNSLVIFEIYYLKNAVKGYEKQFDRINPSYWVVVSGENELLNSFTTPKSYGLGKARRLIDFLLKDGGKIVRSKISDKIEKIILGLKE